MSSDFVGLLYIMIDHTVAKPVVRRGRHVNTFQEEKHLGRITFKETWKLTEPAKTWLRVQPHPADESSGPPECSMGAPYNPSRSLTHPTLTPFLVCFFNSNTITAGLTTVLLSTGKIQYWLVFLFYMSWDGKVQTDDTDCLTPHSPFVLSCTFPHAPF